MVHPYVTIVMKHGKKVHHYREVVVDAYLPVYQAISSKAFNTQQHLLAHTHQCKYFFEVYFLKTWFEKPKPGSSYINFWRCTSMVLNPTYVAELQLTQERTVQHSCLAYVSHFVAISLYLSSSNASYHMYLPHFFSKNL